MSHEINKNGVPQDTLDAINDTPIESAGGGQYQAIWAETPEGQAYIAAADDREKAYAAEADYVAASIAKQVVEPTNVEFENAPDETLAEDGAEDESVTGSPDDSESAIVSEVEDKPARTKAKS